MKEFVISIEKAVVRISNFQIIYTLQHAQPYEVNLMNVGDLIRGNCTMKKISKKPFVHI